MKVTLELPDWVRCVSVTAVGIFIAAIGIRDVSDGDTFILKDPKKKEDSE